MTPPLIPPPVCRGDTIGVIAPAGCLVDWQAFAGGLRILQEMGYNVRYPRELWPGADHLADSDERRAEECNQLFAAREVKAIIALRGGFGCLRMLRHLNLELITTHPKLLVGFSDISLLQTHLYTQTGLLSLHGPVLTSLERIEEGARRRLARCLNGYWREPLPLSGIEVLRPAKTAAAPLLGGNLASLVSLLGTPYDFSWKGKIIFLEDVNEPVYRIDRMLTQLALAGKFTDLTGLLLGDFSGLYTPDDQRQERYLETIWDRVLELCRHGRFPIWANLPAGHRADNQTLPFGAIALMQEDVSYLGFR